MKKIGTHFLFVLFNLLFLSVQCISSIGHCMCVCVCQSVSLSLKTSWTLCRSQSFTDLRQTCHRGSVRGDAITYPFLVDIWTAEVHQTRSGINFYHSSYEKMCNIKYLKNGNTLV